MERKEGGLEKMEKVVYWKRRGGFKEWEESGLWKEKNALKKLKLIEN